MRCRMKAPNLAGLPASLKTAKRWVLWKIESHPKTGKPTKVPYSVAGFKASSINPRSWASFDDVCKKLKQYDGAGYVLGPNASGKYCVAGFDIDTCLGPK